MNPTPQQASKTRNEQGGLDQTLARLSAVDVPDGLEQRILARLARNPVAGTNPVPSRSATSRPLPSSSAKSGAASWSAMSLWHRSALLASATLAGAALIVGGVRHRIPAAPATSPSARAITSAPPAATSSHPDVVPPALASAQRRVQTFTRANHPSTPTSHSTSNPDADLALAELRAPSQLAPPLSLTADERALKHLAQHSTPEVLNALNPDRNRAQLVAERAAFQDFFSKPVIPESRLRGESN